MSEPRRDQQTAGAQWLAPRTLVRHARLYAVAAGILVLLDFLLTDGWWSPWPLLGWGALLAVHFLFVKSLRTEERWADQRAAELADKAYDFSHIESIRERYAGKDAPGRRRDRAAERALAGLEDEEPDRGEAAVRHRPPSGS